MEKILTEHIPSRNVVNLIAKMVYEYNYDKLVEQFTLKIASRLRQSIDIIRWSLTRGELNNSLYLAKLEMDMTIHNCIWNMQMEREQQCSCIDCRLLIKKKKQPKHYLCMINDRFGNWELRRC